MEGDAEIGVDVKNPSQLLVLVDVIMEVDAAAAA